MTACGTAFYACMVAKYWFEKLARLPVEIEVASEFRYREPPLPEGGVCIAVSQSGETIDTLEALRYANRKSRRCCRWSTCRKAPSHGCRMSCC